PIVGYLLAGILAGPFTPGFVADGAVAEQFAEIGVILLLFGIGLRFHLKELFAVWRIAVPGALIQSALSTILMAVLLHWMGWSWKSGIILGIAISVASTVVMALVLAGHHDLHAPIGHIAIGWTVVEDLLTVAVLLLLPLLFGPNGGDESNVAAVLGVAALKVLGLVAAVAVLGTWVIPRVLESIARTRSRELFTLAVLVIAVGIAVGSALLFGVSMALGAFLAGLAVGRSEFAARAANDALPMRDAFAVLFFVSVGMLFNPRAIIETPLPIALVVLVVIVGKPLIAALTVRLLGKPVEIAIPVGAAFSQVGEFSFILGTVARELGLLSDTGWNSLVAGSILSIALNPTCYRLARKWSSRTMVREPNRATESPQVDDRHCILVGFGPVGRIVHRLLLAQDFRVTVVDLNLDAVRELHNQGRTAIYGDVLRPGTLEEAGIATAGNLILSADVDDAAEIVRYSRAFNPKLDILVRCAHLRDVKNLEQAGATRVFAGEAEVGVALAEAVQFDEERGSDEVSFQRDFVRARLYSAT
ncbi:MAG TPA: cation:proton antiporter, partial [Polyangiaceae bacterium]|nr:cation:proton antiporter [Polyangiaceae bacterium]